MGHNIKPVMMMYGLPEYEDAKSVWVVGGEGKTKEADIKRLEKLRERAGKAAEDEAKKEAKKKAEAADSAKAEAAKAEAAKAEAAEAATAATAEAAKAAEEAIKKFNSKWFNADGGENGDEAVKRLAEAKDAREKGWWTQLRAVREKEQNDQLWTDADPGVLKAEYRDCPKDEAGASP